MSILDGFIILLDKGYKRVLIQMDNLEGVNALSMKGMMDSSITLLRKISRLLSSGGQWEVRCIHRDCNLVADQMTNIGLSR